MLISQLCKVSFTKGPRLSVIIERSAARKDLGGTYSVFGSEGDDGSWVLVLRRDAHGYKMAADDRGRWHYQSLKVHGHVVDLFNTSPAGFIEEDDGRITVRVQGNRAPYMPKKMIKRSRSRVSGIDKACIELSSALDRTNEIIDRYPEIQLRLEDGRVRARYSFDI